MTLNAPAISRRLVLRYEAVGDIGMAVHRRCGFCQRKHPVGRRARHSSYAADTERPRGCFPVDPEIALLGEYQAGVANCLQNRPTRVVDGHYCILTPGDVA